MDNLTREVGIFRNDNSRFVGMRVHDAPSASGHAVNGNQHPGHFRHQPESRLAAIAKRLLNALRSLNIHARSA